MKAKKTLAAKLTPDWAIPTAFAFRCLWRRWRFAIQAPSQPVSEKSALIVAPHPDDETFGCGALICLKRKLGVPVRVLFLTGGENVASCIGLEKKTVISARRQEAETACRHLGVQPDELKWLQLPDGSVPRIGEPGFEKALQLLLNEINAFAPGEIFCPHPLDSHHDHAAAAELVGEAAQRAAGPFEIVHYPVWMWYHASLGLGRRLKTKSAWRLDGGTVRSKKHAAMAAYLESEKARNGLPYCGKLPWAFLWNFRQRSELFFSEPSRD